ncbi:uncharacterized protein LOC119936280 isoform X2 [Tachyglossus aculeatus]|uniref:uncharacterized protein LOC119936280 isoform X2 n=1 Tax=Tachyglossus aculeatus TaxID=9261 RepID=UPI0018F74342|nr:uncharacterized protein LOC119936280 isoform X2 [Tachyglossus aculeatus]
MRLCLLGCLVTALTLGGSGTPLGMASTREEPEEQVKIKRLKRDWTHLSSNMPFHMLLNEDIQAIQVINGGVRTTEENWIILKEFPSCCNGSMDGPRSGREGGEASRNSSTQDIYVVFGTFMDPAEEETLRRSHCEGCCGKRVTLIPESWRSLKEGGDVSGTSTTDMDKTGEMKVNTLGDNINVTFAFSGPSTRVWKKESELCASCCPIPRTNQTEVPASGEEERVGGSSPGQDSVQQGPQNPWTNLGHLIRRIQVHYPNGSYQLYETYKLQMPLETCLPCPTGW